MRPKLKENVWRIDPDAETAVLITGGEAYNIPYAPAQIFMAIRPFCTGHLSLDEISKRSGVSRDDVDSLLRSLSASGMIYNGEDTGLSANSISTAAACKRVVDLWAQELAATYIGNEFGLGKLSRMTLLGWLIEMYHYIKAFPEDIAVAARCSASPLTHIFEQYSREETGHEKFVLRTLVNLGLSKAEVENSTPLLSTKTISMLMRDLFEFEPIAVFLVAALVEAQDFNEDGIERFVSVLSEHYDIDPSAMAPYFEHQRIDVQLGHAELLDINSEWVDKIPLSKMDRVIDAVHDIKHAFELQGLEIKQYYTDLNGKYFPRQRMELASIL